MKKSDLTKGSILKSISSLAIPIMAGSLLQFTYNMIDMMYVGGLGSNAVASIGSASFFVNIGYAVNSLVVVGTGIKTAHAVGEKDTRKSYEYINAGSIINFFMAIIYAAILVLFGRRLIEIIGIDSEVVLKDGYLYLAVSAPMMFFSFFNMLYTRIMSSFGNNKTSFYISAAGVIINVILDPIFIYNFNMGVIGAAIATLIANFIMFILFIFKLRDIVKINIKVNTNYIREIITLGIPTSFQRIIFTVINIVLARIIAKYGADAIAAQKIGLQIESLSYMVIGGLNGAMASFAGQNYGAHKFNRIKRSYKQSLFLAMIYSLILSIVFLLFDEYIIRLFINEGSTIKIASSYLKYVSMSLIFSAVEMVSAGLFIGIGKPKVPAMVSIIFTAMRIPVSIILEPYLMLDAVWASIAFTSILKGSVLYLIYMMRTRKEII